MASLTESAFYAFMAKKSSDHVPSSAWYIDFGASRHFSHRRDWFIDFSPFSDSVVFGGGEEYTMVDRGTIQIKSSGRTLIFLNVYYVLGMDINLLSVSEIMRNSPQLDVVFSAHKCSIIDREPSLTVAVGREDHGIYRLLDTGDSPEVALAARVSPISTLWHQRYGHLNMQYLSQLSREGLVSGLPDIQSQQLGVCGVCQAGKQHWSSFKDGESWRASKVTDIRRLNNMMSDHGIYSRERLLIPVIQSEILVNQTCYIELDIYAKREVAVLYLEGAPDGKSSYLTNSVPEKTKRRLLDSMKRSLQADDGTVEYYLSISNGNLRTAFAQFSHDLRWEEGHRTS